MCLITAYFARALQSCTSRIGVHFLLTFQEVTSVGKTRNQLSAHCHLLREMCGASPVMNKLLCPGKAILAGFSGRVALCPFSAISGPQDGNVSSLARRIDRLSPKYGAVCRTISPTFSQSW